MSTNDLEANEHVQSITVDDEPTSGVSGSERASDALCALAPVGLLAELTHRCPLQCSYCSNPIELERVNVELSTEQWVSVMEQAGDMGILQVHLSGGEPTARKDLEEIISAASKAGLYTNLITAAVTLNRARLEDLAKRGLDHVQISFQDVDPENAERIGAYPGATQKKLDVARWVTELGLPLTVNAPIHRQNIHNVGVGIALGYATHAAPRLRDLLGHFDPSQAGLLTIRGRFGQDSLDRARAESRLVANVIHSSDDPDGAQREFGIWYGPSLYHLLCQPAARL
jgi:nucleoside diphosphate kinase